MNEVIKNILTRRSCRNFSDKQIDRKELEQILKAAVYAPTGRGSQDWTFTATADKVKILDLADAVKKALNMPRDAVYNFYNATAIVIIANDRNYKYAKQDCGAAMENIMLAAHSLGIASCWINQLCDTYDDPGVRSLLESFGIGKDKIVSAVAALGYAASPVGEPAPRKAEAINFID